MHALQLKLSQSGRAPDVSPARVDPPQTSLPPEILRASQTDRSSGSGDSRGSKQSNQRQGQTTGDRGGNSREVTREREKSQKAAAKAFEVCEREFKLLAFFVVCQSLISLLT